jgi:tRNA pseudouridine38-40 synthase
VHYRLTLAYVGTRYAGWQRQPDAPTVQAELESALERLSGAPARTIAAGRTDAGVHAEGQLVSCALARELPEPALVSGTNHFLPADVRVLAAERAPAEFDARRDAAAKVYRYRLAAGARVAPERAPFVLAAGERLDFARLEAGARALVGRHDFSAFRLAGGAARTSERRIFAAGWRREGDELVFRIVGEGFLRGMVRGLVGTLVDVGAGRRRLDEMVALLAGGERGDAGPTAPAHGLCLERVDLAAAPATPPPRSA